MSLLDSLLLDPYRDPREVWIALRTDGQTGTGTIADPFDGSKKAGQPLAGFLTLKWAEFVVELGNVAADLPNFDPVKSKLRFEGVTGPAKDWFNYSASGNEFQLGEVTRYQTNLGQPSALGFVVEPFVPPGDPPASPPMAPPNVQFTWNGYINTKYTYTDMNGQPAVGPPFNLSAKIVWPVAKLAFFTTHGLVNFDAVELSNFDGNNSHFNGTYVLAGQTDKSVRIRLSDRFPDSPGADITVPLSCFVRKLTYRFDQIMRSAPDYALFHLGPGAFETRGFAPTYISNQNDYREMFVGFILRFGQRLCGSGIGASVVQLALPVDELSNTVAIGNPSTNSADFAEVADLTVDCNASGHLVPYGIFPAPVTCGAVNLGGSFIALRRVRAIHFCTQTVAECFVLALAGEANPTLGSYLPTGTFNVIEDCILEQPGENNTHETTLISSVGDAYGRGRSPVVRRNFVNCEYSGGSSELVAVDSDSYTRMDNHAFKVTTKRPHHRVVGQNIRLNGATLASEPNSIPPFYFLQDTFKITAVDTTTGEITCYSPSIIPTAALTAAGFIGVDFHGPAALGGTGCVTEGNALYDCYNAFYNDTGATRDAVVRDNYYSNVLYAIYFNYAGGPGGESARNGASLKRDAQNHRIAIFEATTAHFISPGLVVTIDGARVNGSVNNPYNGNHRVIAVSADASGDVRYFHYEMKQIPNPDQDADLPTEQLPLKFQVRWQNPRHSFERNNYDLYPYDEKSPLQSYGFSTYAYNPLPPFTVPASPPYLFPGVVIRENVLRLRDDAPGRTAANGGDAAACRLDNIQNTLIEANVVNLPGPFHIHYLNSGDVLAFNNRTPAGAQEPLFEDTSGYGALSGFRRDSGLDDEIEDALILSLL